MQTSYGAHLHHLPGVAQRLQIKIRPSGEDSQAALSRVPDGDDSHVALVIEVNGLGRRDGESLHGRA